MNEVRKETPIVQVNQSDLDAMANKSMIQGGGLTSAIFVIAYGLMWLRKRLSQDNLEAKKASTESHLLEIVIKERNTAMDDAREAWAKRAGDAELIGRLTAQVSGLEQLNHKTNNEVHLLRLLNEKQSAEMVNIRAEFSSMREQMRTCATCPLKKGVGRNEDPPRT